MKNDCNLFSRLHISCQPRDGNIAEFFKHEDQAPPPSLFTEGQIRSGKKADLLVILKKSTVHQQPNVDAKILDGAVIVNMLPPGKSETFEEYAKGMFINYFLSLASSVSRLDVG